MIVLKEIKKLSITEIANIYGYKRGFINNLICRPEIAKYGSSYENESKYTFLDCDGFHRALRKAIRLKLKSKGVTCRLTSTRSINDLSKL